MSEEKQTPIEELMDRTRELGLKQFPLEFIEALHIANIKQQIKNETLQTQHKAELKEAVIEAYKDGSLQDRTIRINELAEQYYTSKYVKE